SRRGLWYYLSPGHAHQIFHQCLFTLGGVALVSWDFLRAIFRLSLESAIFESLPGSSDQIWIASSKSLTLSCALPWVSNDAPKLLRHVAASLAKSGLDSNTGRAARLNRCDSSCRSS